MSSAFKVITQPSIEPVTIAEAKAYLRVDYSDEDSVIAGLISRARAYAETVTGRAFATQVVQELFTIERPIGGELSGPIDQGPNWYQYQQSLGGNPFGATQFYFDVSMPPIQVAQPITIQTRTTVFDAWQTFAGLYTVDDTSEPARLYFQVPVTANQWQFTFTCGYWTGYPLPYDLKQALLELISYWFDHREAEGEEAPVSILHKLQMRKVNWI